MSVQSPGAPSAQFASGRRLEVHPVDGLAGMIHRPYFVTAILTILTVGASWGVLILWRIGFDESFTAVSVHEINAHGHAQISGWVGLFMMGFAYRAFPRVWRTSLVAPRLAIAVFGAMLLGLTMSTLGLGIEGTAPAIPLAVAGGIIEVVAIGTFAAQIMLTYRRSGARLDPFTGFVMVALGWFVTQAAFALWHTWMTMTAATYDDLLWYIATYQAPLRDMQIHGMAMTMVLGVSTFVLPAVFGAAPVPARRAWRALALLGFGVLGEVLVFIAYRWTDNFHVAALLMIPWLMIAVGAFMVARSWLPWRPLPRDDGRSGKFVRAAYAWLGVSLVMLILMPAYQVVSGIAFSHAYYGAIRHAITVGFISLMIMGISSRAVPAFHAVQMRSLPHLWGPFLLVNIGCFLRVSLQTLTDWHPMFFDLVGISGLLELTGIAWWGIGLITLLRQNRTRQPVMSR